MTRHGGATYYIIAAIFLAIAVGYLSLAAKVLLITSEERELVLSTDDCLKADKRAVMLCPRYGRCFIECREKTND